jgi:hypothetical protein
MNEAPKPTQAALQHMSEAAEAAKAYPPDTHRAVRTLCAVLVHCTGALVSELAETRETIHRFCLQHDRLYR